MRKPRTDSTLDYLEPDQTEQLMEWILGRVPYRTIVESMLEKYEVETSIRAISKYWQKYGAEHWKARRSNALQMAQDVAQDAAENSDTFAAATIEVIEQKVFSMAMDPTASGKELKALVQLLIKHSEQQLRERTIHVSEERLKLEHKRFARETCELFLIWYQDKRASEIGDNSGTTTEQKVEQLGTLIFGDDW